MFIGCENDSKKAMISLIWLILGLIYLTSTEIYGQVIKEKDFKEEWTDRIDRIAEEWKTQKVEMEKKYLKLVEDGKITEEQAIKDMEKEANAWMEKRVKEERKEYEKELPTMPYKYFYGKVVDQNGDPVEGADVDYGVFDIRKHTITDKNGLFKINEKGIRSLDILIRGKEGYDAKSTLPKVYYYEKDGSYKYENELSRTPDPTTPEIFKLRKKGEPTMLLTSGGTSNMSFDKEKESSFSIDVLSPAGYNCSPFDSSGKATKRVDLLVSSEYMDGAFIIKIKAIGEKGAGLILSEEKLYDAPDDRYNAEYELKAAKQYGAYDPLYLYCRTGEPLVYSMLKLEIYPSEQSVKVKFYSYCNPYGERNFEQGRYMYSTKKIEALKDEAWKALE